MVNTCTKWNIRDGSRISGFFFYLGGGGGGGGGVKFRWAKCRTHPHWIRITLQRIYKPNNKVISNFGLFYQKVPDSIYHEFRHQLFFHIFHLTIQLIYSFIHSFIHLHFRSPIYLFIHSFIISITSHSTSSVHHPLT